MGNPDSTLDVEILKVHRSTTYGNTGAGLNAETNGWMNVSQTDVNELPNTWVNDGTSCILTYSDNYTNGSASPCSGGNTIIKR